MQVAKISPDVQRTDNPADMRWIARQGWEIWGTNKMGMAAPLNRVDEQTKTKNKTFRKLQAAITSPEERATGGASGAFRAALRGWDMQGRGIR